MLHEIIWIKLKPDKTIMKSIPDLLIYSIVLETRLLSTLSMEVLSISIAKTHYQIIPGTLCI